MTLIKRDYRLSDPFSDLDRFFNRSSWEGDYWPGFLPFANRERLGRGFPVNIYGDDDAYYLIAELPGVSKEDIDLKLENSVLNITAKRSLGEGDDVKEFKLGRSVTVGDDINPESVTAKLENGVLSVTLPKTEARKAKAITIG